MRSSGIGSLERSMLSSTFDSFSVGIDLLVGLESMGCSTLPSMKSRRRSTAAYRLAASSTMAKKDDSGDYPVPRWLRLLLEKLRVADQAASYPYAVPPRPPKPSSDAPTDHRGPPSEAPPTSGGEN